MTRSVREERAVIVGADAVQLDVAVSDVGEAIRCAGAPLVEAGLVTSGYIDAVVARERRFPTGLPTRPHAIAVPHADPDGVRTPSFAFLRTSAPVSFVEMATVERVLDVRLVLLLALQSKEQAAILGSLIRALQDESLVDFLATAASSGAIADRLAALVNGRT